MIILLFLSLWILPLCTDFPLQHMVMLLLSTTKNFRLEGRHYELYIVRSLRSLARIWFPQIMQMFQPQSVMLMVNGITAID